MPLTKSDLQKIGNVVDEKLEKRLGPIEQRLIPIEQRLIPIEQRLIPIEKDLKYLRKKVNKMARTVDLIGRNYDEGDVKLAKRVKRIEEHLDLPRNNN